MSEVLRSPRTGWIMIVAGLLCALLWTAGVSSVVPKPFLGKVGESTCSNARAAGHRVDGVTLPGHSGDSPVVQVQFFPPSARCVYPAEHYAYEAISPVMSAVLMAIFVLLMLLVLAGVVIVAIAAASRQELTPPSRPRAGVHILVAGLLGLGAAVVSPLIGLMVMLLTDWLGGLLFAAITLAGLTAVAARSDAAVGPGRGGVGGAVRRGVVVGLVGVSAIATISYLMFFTWNTHGLDLNWRILLPVPVFVAVAALQWLPRVTSAATSRPAA